MRQDQSKDGRPTCAAGLFSSRDGKQFCPKFCGLQRSIAPSTHLALEQHESLTKTPDAVTSVKSSQRQISAVGVPSTRELRKAREQHVRPSVPPMNTGLPGCFSPLAHLRFAVVLGAVAARALRGTTDVSENCRLETSRPTPRGARVVCLSFNGCTHFIRGGRSSHPLLGGHGHLESSPSSRSNGWPRCNCRTTRVAALLAAAQQQARPLSCLGGSALAAAAGLA